MLPNRKAVSSYCYERVMTTVKGGQERVRYERKGFCRTPGAAEAWARESASVPEFRDVNADDNFELTENVAAN